MNEPPFLPVDAGSGEDEGTGGPGDGETGGAGGGFRVDFARGES